MCGVLSGSVVKSMTCNLEATDSSFTGSIIVQGTSEPQPSTGETKGVHVSCCRDMSEMMLKAA